MTSPSMAATAEPMVAASSVRLPSAAMSSPTLGRSTVTTVLPRLSSSGRSRSQTQEPCQEPWTSRKVVVSVMVDQTSDHAGYSDSEYRGYSESE